jgi:DNA-directed RNA polymerase specialized sigma24 family protein
MEFHMPVPLICPDPLSNKENSELDSNHCCDSSFSGEIQELFQSIWISHFEEIKRRCRCKLCSADRLIHYEEDLANDVMLAIWSELTSRNHRAFFSMEDIWIAILRLIEERAINRATYLNRKRRRCPSQLERLFDYSANEREFKDAALLQVEAAETWETLMGLAPDEQFSELLQLKRDGFDVRDIAIKFRLSIRSVQRKLHQLRTLYMSTLCA